MSFQRWGTCSESRTIQRLPNSMRSSNAFCRSSRLFSIQIIEAASLAASVERRARSPITAMLRSTGNISYFFDHMPIRWRHHTVAGCDLEHARLFRARALVHPLRGQGIEEMGRGFGFHWSCAWVANAHQWKRAPPERTLRAVCVQRVVVVGHVYPETLREYDLSVSAAL